MKLVGGTIEKNIKGQESDLEEDYDLDEETEIKENSELTNKIMN